MKNTSNEKKYAIKVSIIVAAIIIILLAAASISVGLYIYFKNQYIISRQADEYRVYDEFVYKKKNDRLIKEMILVTGQNINDTDETGKGALHKAILSDNMKALKFLIENDADVNTFDSEGISPLLLAIKKENIPAVKLLLEKGKADMYDEDGNGINRPIYEAIKKENIKIIKEFINNSFDVNKNYSYEPSAITYAVIYSTNDSKLRETINILIEKGADINEVYTNEDGEKTTSIYWAVVNSKPEIVSFLIEKGAKVQNAGEIESFGNILSVSSGNFLIFQEKEEYLENPIIEEKDKINSALITETLLKNGATNLIDSKDKNGYNPVATSSIYGFNDTVKKLVEYKANINIQDKNGLTPLIYAIEQDNKELANFLIENGADLNMAEKEYDRTPIFFSIENKNTNITEILISKGANVNAVDKNGVTPLNIAIKEDGNIDIIKLLVKNKADLNILTEEGDSLIEYAINKNDTDMIQTLVEGGVNLNVAGISSNTPLMTAVSKSLENIVRIFLTKNDINLNAINRNWNTALHMAAKNGNSVIIKMLIDKGANVDARNKQGYTPLHTAVENNNLEAANEIINGKANVEIRADNMKRPIDIAMDKKEDSMITLLKNAMKKSSSENQ